MPLLGVGNGVGLSARRSRVVSLKESGLKGRDGSTTPLVGALKVPRCVSVSMGFEGSTPGEGASGASGAH